MQISEQVLESLIGQLIVNNQRLMAQVDQLKSELAMERSKNQNSIPVPSYPVYPGIDWWPPTVTSYTQSYDPLPCNGVSIFCGVEK